MTENDYCVSSLYRHGSARAQRTARKSVSKSHTSLTKIKLMRFFAGVLSSLLLVLLVNHTSGKKNVPSNIHTFAADGVAYAVSETPDGVNKHIIKTQRKVMSVFGFAADNATLLYTSLNSAGEPVPGLFMENVVTGDLRKVSSRIIFAARWSPRDLSTAAITFADESGSGVAILNTATGAETVLSREGVLPDKVEWDATGTHVSFIRADEHSQLIYKPGVTRPVDEYPYTILTHRSVAIDEPVSPYHKSSSLTAEDTSKKLAVMARHVEVGEIPPASSIDETSVPSDLYAYSLQTEDGTEIIGENLIGTGKIYARVTPGGEAREIANGQLVDALNHGVVVREFEAQQSTLKYVGLNGQSVALASTSVTYGLPLASSIVTQGGGGYPDPGRCRLYDHNASSSTAYAYDFQNSTSGAHVLASAAGLVVYVRKDVTCNSCDSTGCSAYPSGGCPSSSSNGGWGNTVIIQHADGTYTKYNHLQANSLQVAVGDNVCAGRYVGRQGFTGCSIGNMEGCGSHLHFQRQSSSALSGTSQSITFAENPSGPLSCGNTYRSSLTETTCATSGQARPVVTTSLGLSSSGPHVVGQTVSAYFTITNRGTQSITLARLLVGGRLNGDQSCSGGCPDFSSVSNVTLAPGQSYSYRGSRYLDRIGSYSFFVSYQKQDNSWITNVDTENGAVKSLAITVNGLERPVVKSSLRLSSSGSYYVSQTIYGYFTIINRGTGPITFRRLLIGGRLNGDQSCSGGCPDFSSVANVTLSPGRSYSYSGSRYLDRAGSYGFFVTYQKSDGSWVTSVPSENGAINALTIGVQGAAPTLTGKSPTKIYARSYDQTVYFSGKRLTKTQYMYVQFPNGSGAYIYPPKQIFSRKASKLGCKIKFGSRGQYYVRAYTSDGGWSNALAVYVY